MGKNRLVHVIESAAGGSLKYVRDICNNIDRSTWACSVIYSRRPDTPPEIEGLFTPGVNLIEVPMVRRISPLKDAKSLFLLMSQLQKIEPDIIHLHSSKAGALGRIIAAQTGIPSIYTPHGFAFFRRDVNKLMQSLYLKMEQTIQKFWPSMIVVGSEHEFEHAKRMAGTSNARMVVNSVEVPPHPTPLEKDSPWVVSSGRLTHAKNPELVLEVFRRVKNVCPDAKFAWIGDGELRSTIENRSSRLGLDLHITGWVSTPEVLWWLRRSRVVVHASKWEGMPFSLLEAMSMARPIVASNIDAHRNILKQGLNGYLATLPQEYVQYIKMLLNSRQRSWEVGEQAWRTVHKDYSLDRFMDSIVTVYNQSLRHKESIL